MQTINKIHSSNPINFELALEVSWRQRLKGEFQKPYMVALSEFLKKELSSGKSLFPKTEDIFAAFKAVPYSSVKAVIIGQDPYHGEGQAHGLCFSVRPTVAAPPSLVNIYKELKSDLGLELPQHGYLKSWAEQGVLLLNSVLTVEENKAASHKNRGWEVFTDKVIEQLNMSDQSLVFFLWGSYAQKKGTMIDRNKHCVLEAVHPSPLSAYRGFFGCKHFSQANHFLIKNNRSPIHWELPTDVT